MVNRLKELRQKNHLTLKKLGDEINMPNNTLSQYENGKREPKQEVWQKLADFFDVSVPYIQDKTYVEKDLIEMVHNYYFSKFFEMSEIIDGQEVDHIKWISDINMYITMTSNDVLPRKLYPEKESVFKLNDKVRNYWERHLKPIITKDEFKSISKETNSWTVFRTIVWYMEKEIRILEEVNETTTILGEFYINEYDAESDIHNKVMDSIKFADYKTAKKEIDKYFKLIKRLKDRVDNFDPDKYFDEFISEEIEINSNYKNNKFIDEIIHRVKSGDKELQNYLIMNSHKDLIVVYKEYKAKKHEDITEIDNYLHSLDNYYDTEEDFLKAQKAKNTNDE